MRFTCLLALAVCIFSSDACGRRSEARRRHRAVERREREIERGQGIVFQPKDVLYVNFAKNWPQFVSRLPELALPVTRVVQRQPWQPLITAECVFSADAGRMVPQVTLSWNESSGVISSPEIARRRQQQTPAAAAAPVPIRFDLGLHQDAFTRNYFSSALATDKLKRFNLPPNSALTNDTPAVLMTGPGLFPKLMDYRTEALQDPNTNQSFTHQTLVLRDLNHALTYSIRMSRRFSEKEWSGEQEFAFLTPVCPSSF